MFQKEGTACVRTQSIGCVQEVKEEKYHLSVKGDGYEEGGAVSKGQLI